MGGTARAHLGVILSEVEGPGRIRKNERFPGYARNDSETAGAWQTIQATK